MIIYLNMKMAKNKESSNNTMAKVGSWSFLIGLIIALVMGFFVKTAAYPYLVSILIVLGLIVGFLNVTGHETMPFLLASVAMVIVMSMGGVVLGNVQMIGGYLSGVLNSMMIFIVPATIVVALKAIFALAADD